MAEITLKLEHTDMQVMLNMLAATPWPYRESGPLMQKIAQQLQQPAPPPPGNGAEQPQPQAGNG